MLRTMAAFGAEVENVHSHNGKITPDIPATIVKRAKTIVEENEIYYAADQFNNKDCIVGYGKLGGELVEQLPQGIDAFCGAAGGAGMVMGTSKVLKAVRPGTRVVVVESSSAPLLSQEIRGVHGIEGIGPGLIPPLLDSTLYDEIRAYPEEEAREMCRRLAKEEGILAGTSTGLNVVAALALAKELRPGKVVVTVACDTDLPGPCSYWRHISSLEYFRDFSRIPKKAGKNSLTRFFLYVNVTSKIDRFLVMLIVVLRGYW
ncbi:tryptophan synthase beta subunit-like PLP-dependent enzyme [Colletotrichum navitas]|uniref:Tryptophan synthase beta subunit-like PLP-dependent enzyme n=1 Tax=Colletotrichum navitas TaxID=681940 RepID=A0AAD8PNV5_9PEZI|nr:tryptophan synthase beta subunit-like PLP-dependent enzyme [Colletotrichum navitas]KAK1573556.1 tryptophan synthase beta subunit-like PLP-dependent enzyme [Colletotrichum navitas]